MIWKYVRNILIAIDQLANAIAGGDPDETISSRVGKHGETAFKNFINFLFGDGHCDECIEPEEGEDAVLR